MHRPGAGFILPNAWDGGSARILEQAGFAAIGAPVNVVAGLVEPLLDAATLRSLGVARISVGGTLARAVLTLVEQAAREMADHGTFGFARGAIPYAELQQRFSR